MTAPDTLLSPRLARSWSSTSAARRWSGWRPARPRPGNAGPAHACPRPWWWPRCTSWPRAGSLRRSRSGPRAWSGCTGRTRSRGTWVGMGWVQRRGGLRLACADHQRHGDE